MTNHFDVIVVGTGTMGAAACYHLARRGVKVLGLDQYAVPHTFGAHHGGSRIIRLSYFEHPDYVALLKRAYDLWDQLGDESRLKVMHLVGGLYLGNPRAKVMAGVKRAADEFQLEHDDLSHDDLRTRFPMFTLPEQTIGFFEDKAGFVVPELAVAAHAQLTVQHGGELHGHERVVDWSATGRGVRVTSDKATYEADHVVFAAGAWSRQVVARLGVDLTVTRQVLGWVCPRRPEMFDYPDFPIWNLDITESDAPFAGLYYGFPMIADSPGLKLAFHLPGTPCDPNTVRREPVQGDAESFMPCLRKFLPDGIGPVLAIRVCLYTNSPDSHFIIDRHPEHENVTVACGFSGHGFKFATVVGEILADLATQGRAEMPIAFLGLGRFDR